jgi:hypothetical protein
LLWLFGPNALAASVEGKERTDFEAEQGGCYTLRFQDGFAFTRCAAFRHRPAQADLLHVDLWWRGQNIALDAGTFSYNAPVPWNDPLSHTAHHNTVTVDGRDQMDRVGRFLWLPWTTGRVRSHKRSAAGHLAYWEGEHDGYARLNVPALHRRAIVRIGEHWLVLDRVTSAAEHDYRLHWLLMDAAYDCDESKKRLTLKTPAGSYFVEVASAANDSSCSIVRADESSPRGWRAPYYNYLEPALSFALTARGSSLSFWTAFGPEPCRVTLNDDKVQMQTEKWQAKIDLQVHNSLVASIGIAGAIDDQLEIA